ncbi:hypothetical protein MIND_01090300 [Mycena indigotica]|uniref:Uncharacterized protein n=1 Tax=Mycena indigotica TaxID=2126181 RepID=A0A8H6S9V1_9AGAR|nr:uncharacterized protein MIND_01090300 [Mycena indigotica]KAF7295504.1 hypothetical protein MIND_01090300 [Mycena indigotica]
MPNLQFGTPRPHTTSCEISVSLNPHIVVHNVHRSSLEKSNMFPPETRVALRSELTLTNPQNFDETITLLQGTKGSIVTVHGQSGGRPSKDRQDGAVQYSVKFDDYPVKFTIHHAELIAL